MRSFGYHICACLHTAFRTVSEVLSDSPCLLRFVLNSGAPCRDGLKSTEITTVDMSFFHFFELLARKAKS